jgi:hypothetical protein
MHRECEVSVETAGGGIELPHAQLLKHSSTTNSFA